MRKRKNTKKHLSRLLVLAVATAIVVARLGLQVLAFDPEAPATDLKDLRFVDMGTELYTLDGGLGLGQSLRPAYIDEELNSYSAFVQLGEAGDAGNANKLAINSDLSFSKISSFDLAHATKLLQKIDEKEQPDFLNARLFANNRALALARNGEGFALYDLELVAEAPKLKCRKVALPAELKELKLSYIDHDENVYALGLTADSEEAPGKALLVNIAPKADHARVLAGLPREKAVAMKQMFLKDGRLYFFNTGKHKADEMTAWYNIGVDGSRSGSIAFGAEVYSGKRIYQLISASERAEGFELSYLAQSGEDFYLNISLLRPLEGGTRFQEEILMEARLNPELLLDDNRACDFHSAAMLDPTTAAVSLSCATSGTENGRNYASYLSLVDMKDPIQNNTDLVARYHQAADGSLTGRKLSFDFWRRGDGVAIADVHDQAFDYGVVSRPGRRDRVQQLRTKYTNVAAAKLALSQIQDSKVQDEKQPSAPAQSDSAPEETPVALVVVITIVGVALLGLVIAIIVLAYRLYQLNRFRE